MIVDSSVVIAILRDEPEAAEFSEILVDVPARMSAANWLEAAIIADRSPDPHPGNTSTRSSKPTESLSSR